MCANRCNCKRKTSFCSPPPCSRVHSTKVEASVTLPTVRRRGGSYERFGGHACRPRTRSDALETADVGVVAPADRAPEDVLRFLRFVRCALRIFMTPNVSPSQLHLAVGGSGVFGRMIVDGSSGSRACGRQTKVTIEIIPLLFSCFALI